MSLLIGLESAIRSIRASTTALNTASHNVANMNTLGYSRQVAILGTTTPIDNISGAGQIGTGTTISRIERIRDIYLDRQIRSELEKLGEWSAMQQTNQILKSIFTEVDDPAGAGLSSQLQAFWDSLDTLSAKVESDPGNTLAEKMEVYSKAQSLTKTLNNRAQALIDLQVDLNAAIRGTITDINSLLKQITELNKGIASAQFRNQYPNDLMDKRDLALAKLSELINVNINTKTNGMVVVSAGSQTLVAGGTYQTLIWDSGDKDSKLEKVSVTVGAMAVDITSSIRSGQLGGLIKSRDESISWYRTQLDSLANTMIATVNKIHMAASAEGIAFFTGSRATDMSVSMELGNGAKIADQMDYYATYTSAGVPVVKTMNIAEIMANLENKLMATWVRSDKNVGYNTYIGNLGTAPAAGQIGMMADGKITINGVEVAYYQGETMGALVERINSINPEKFMAFIGNVERNGARQQLFIMSNDAMTIEESDGQDFISDKTTRLALTNEIISAGPINYQGAINGNYVRATYSNPAAWPPTSTFYTWEDEMNKIDLEPIAGASGGVVSVISGGTKYFNNWTTADYIQGTMLGMMQGDVSTAAYVDYTTKTIHEDWDLQKFAFGSKAKLSGSTYTLSPFYISDKSGNMTQTMKLINSVRFEDFYESVVSNLRANYESSTVILEEYQATVDNLQAIQDSITQVNEDEEIAIAKKYQRAYDASVRLMAVIDQMMNMLINRTGSQSSSDE